MTTVLLIVHLLVASALVAVILMQRSEGGALGIGGGPGGMMSGRGAANLMTRLTMILGAIFVANSILLAIVSGIDSTTGRSVFDEEVIEGDDESLEGLFGDAFRDEGEGESAAEPDAETPSIPAEEPAEDSEEPSIPGR